MQCLTAQEAGAGPLPWRHWASLGHSPPPSQGCSWIPPPPAGRWFLRCSSSWINDPHLGKKPEARVPGPGSESQDHTPSSISRALCLCLVHNLLRAQCTRRLQLELTEGCGPSLPTLGSCLLLFRAKILKSLMRAKKLLMTRKPISTRVNVICSQQLMAVICVAFTMCICLHYLMHLSHQPSKAGTINIPILQ